MSDDPGRLARQLVECLAQDKKPLGILLGAGCPFSIEDESGDPLIPDIKGLTEKIKTKICFGAGAKPWEKIVNQLLEDQGKEPNIEDILSRIRGLKDYAGDDKVRGLNKSELIDLEKEICDEIKSCVDKQLPNSSTPYHKLAVWIGAINRSDPVEIFTTNYDLLMEQALEDYRVPFFDGFVGARQAFFDPYAIELDKLPARWAKLWKIHGSINWRSETIGETLKVWRTDVEKGGNVVIHPSHLKYEQSRMMPYLAMMDRLRNFLSNPSNALVIIGYSFRDEHLNHVIVQGLQGSSSAAFALMYGPIDTYLDVISLGKERGNLSVIAEDGAIIGTKEYYWKELDEKPDVDMPEGAVRWAKGPKEGDLWQATFALGDYRIFGNFLQEISGMKNIGRDRDG